MINHGRNGIDRHNDRQPQGFRRPAAAPGDPGGGPHRRLRSCRRHRPGVGKRNAGSLSRVDVADETSNELTPIDLTQLLPNLRSGSARSLLSPSLSREAERQSALSPTVASRTVPPTGGRSRIGHRHRSTKAAAARIDCRLKPVSGRIGLPPVAHLLDLTRTLPRPGYLCASLFIGFRLGL